MEECLISIRNMTPYENHVMKCHLFSDVHVQSPGYVTCLELKNGSLDKRMSKQNTEKASACSSNPYCSGAAKPNVFN